MSHEPETALDGCADVSRRKFLEGTAAALIVANAGPLAAAGQSPATPSSYIQADPAVPGSTIQITLNGSVRRVEVEDRWTLAEMLRDHLGLTGTKIGCDRGECGACTVLLDG